MKILDLFESPQWTFPQEFGLSDPKINRKTAREWLLKNNKTAIKKIGDYTLYEFPRAFILFKTAPNTLTSIAYFMRYDIKFHKFIGYNCAQQILIWRDELINEAEGIAKEIFFNHLLPNHKVIITDSSQTPDGERFWGNRIREALTLGHSIYYVSLIPHREIIKITNIEQFRKIRDDKDIWGNDAKHQARRIIIAESDIFADDELISEMRGDK